MIFDVGAFIAIPYDSQHYLEADASWYIANGYPNRIHSRWVTYMSSSAGQFFFVLVAASQHVTRSTRQSSQVNSSPAWLITQSTRHKEVVNSSQANKQANIKAVLLQYNYPYPSSEIAAITQKMHKKLNRKQSEQQSTRSVLLTARAEQRGIVWICDCCSNQLLCSSWNQCGPGPIITA